MWSKIQLSNCKFFVFCPLLLKKKEKKKNICQSVDFFIGLCYNLLCIIMQTVILFKKRVYNGKEKIS